MPYVKEFEKQYKSILKHADALITFKSFYVESEKGTPFGIYINDALDYVLNLATKLGFKVFKSPENKYAYIEAGKGDELIGILTHIDVPPVTNPDDWNHDPFEMNVENDSVIGRGTVSGKLPFLQCLFALKALVDGGHKFKKRVRIIVGLTAETNDLSLWAYKEKEEVPSFSFCPDGRFPIYNYEAEIFRYTVSSKQEPPFEINGGSQANTVMAQCKYKGPLTDVIEDELKELEYEYVVEYGDIIVIGNAAHAMENWKGTPALNRLCIGLYNSGIHSDIIDFVAEELGETNDGDYIFGNISDNIIGPARLTISQVKMVDEEQFITLDLRLPIEHDAKHATTLLTKVIERHNLEVRLIHHELPIKFKKNNPNIQKLEKAYKQIMGDKVETLATSAGGTYARQLPNTVTFGPSFLFDEIKRTNVNEHVSMDDMNKAGLVYLFAIEELSK